MEQSAFPVAQGDVTSWVAIYFPGGSYLYGVDTALLGGCPDMGLVQQGRRRSLCIARKHALSSVLLYEGSGTSIGNRCFGISVASDPALCISSSHRGEGSSGGSVVESGGSPLGRDPCLCLLSQVHGRVWHA